MLKLDFFSFSSDQNWPHWHHLTEQPWRALVCHGLVWTCLSFSTFRSPLLCSWRVCRGPFFLFRAIPGCLGSLGQFKTKYSYPIEQGQRHSATKRALATGRKTVMALARKISQWFLRRTKALIKDQLPKKDDRVLLIWKEFNYFLLVII